MKGIVLAAGKGTRMYPMTLPVCKPLLPVYDKPLIYYPISVLMQAGIRDILIIVPPDEMYAFVKLLGDGSDLGLRISYRIQKVQRGIADAFIIGEQFADGEEVCLILGDNIFCGSGFAGCFREAADAAKRGGAVVFGYPVEDPRPFGVVEMGADGRALSIEEKPQHPKSNLIVPGLYFYDGSVCALARTLKPSARGELEITDLNRIYLEKEQLRVVRLPDEITWMDAGNARSLLRAADMVMQHQKQTGRQIACLEEVAWRMGFIPKEQMLALGQSMKQTDYGQYILSL